MFDRGRTRRNPTIISVIVTYFGTRASTEAEANLDGEEDEPYLSNQDLREFMANPGIATSND